MAKKDELDAASGKPAGKNPMLVALGQRIKELRNAAGLSQRQFAEAVGLSQSYVNLLEAGGPNVTVTALNSMAAVLGVSMVDLFRGRNALGVDGATLVTVRDDLRKLHGQLQSWLDRDAELLRLLEQRLALHQEVSGVLLERDDGEDI